MKAAIAPRYGGPEVVRIAEVERPVPQPGEILIRVRASTVSSGDIRMREFLVPPVFWLPFRFELGLLHPKNPVLGVEFSGDVVETGAGVTRVSRGRCGVRLSQPRLSCRVHGDARQGLCRADPSRPWL